MIDGRKVLGLIVGRGGSKGLPRKNVLDLGGRPLVAWSVLAGKGARFIDRLVLSTDDDEIVDAARSAGCDVPFRRPDALAGDTAGMREVVVHALDNLDEAYDLLVLLQATSPLRSSADIDDTIELCVRTNAHSCLTVTAAPKAPEWMYHLAEDGSLEPVLKEAAEATRRQDLRPAYVPNGAVYVVDVEWFRQSGKFLVAGTHALVMPPERSVDIDSRLDLLLARAILAEKLI